MNAMTMTKTKTTNPEILPCAQCGEPCPWGACEKTACLDAFEAIEAAADTERNYDALTGWEEHERDEAGAAYGDARRCPRHPHVKTSSDDGMFDTAGCDECEAESDQAYEDEREAEFQAADAVRYPGGRCVNLHERTRWGFDFEGVLTPIPDPNACQVYSPDDEIPF